MLKRFVRLSSLVEEVVDVAHRMKLESSTGCIDLTKETAALVPADEAEAEETAEARADVSAARGGRRGKGRAVCGTVACQWSH